MTLAEILTLSAQGDDQFEGRSPDDGWPRVFGGLVAAQALVAAYATVESRTCHSLHSYFLRPGDINLPITYAVERVRDGASFSVRRIAAAQNGVTIFAMMASFQTAQDGLEFQAPMPDVAPPEDLVDEIERRMTMLDDLPPKVRAFVLRPQRIEMRWATPAPGWPDSQRAVWMRLKTGLPDDLAIQQAALVYASDMTFLGTAMAAHGLGFWSPGLQAASLDHAVWLHRPTDFSQWHLFVQEANSTGGSRGFVQGRMYARDGTLAASMTQEGLFRIKD